MAKINKNYNSLELIACNILEVQKLISLKNNLVRELRKTRRKIKTQKDYYNFLYYIISPKKPQKGQSHTYNLEYNLKIYFQSLGYKKVCWFGKNSDREDLQIWDGKSVFIIEVKDVNDSNIKRKDLQQLEWRKQLIKNNPEFKGYKLYFIMIVNHQNDIFPIENRVDIPLSDDKLIYLNSNGFAILTTKELFNAYYKIDKKQLSFSIFKKALKNKGVIKI